MNVFIMKQFDEYMQDCVHDFENDMPHISKTLPQIASLLKQFHQKNNTSENLWMFETFLTLAARNRMIADSLFDDWAKILAMTTCPEVFYALPGLLIASIAPKTLQLKEKATIIPKGTRFQSFQNTHHQYHQQTNIGLTLGQDLIICPFVLLSSEIVTDHNNDPMLVLRMSTNGIDITRRYGQSIRCFIDGNSFSALKLRQAMLKQNKQEKISIYACNFSDDLNESYDFTQKILLENACFFLGFGEGDALWDMPDAVHPSNRLLFEYANYMERFLFFDIKLPEKPDANIEKSWLMYDYFDLIIPLDVSILYTQYKKYKNCIKTNVGIFMGIEYTKTAPIIWNHQSHTQSIYAQLPDRKIQWLNHLYAIDPQNNLFQIKHQFLHEDDNIVPYLEDVSWCYQENDEKKSDSPFDEVMLWIQGGEKIQGWTLYAEGFIVSTKINNLFIDHKIESLVQQWTHLDFRIMQNSMSYSCEKKAENTVLDINLYLNRQYDQLSGIWSLIEQVRRNNGFHNNNIVCEKEIILDMKLDSNMVGLSQGNWHGYTTNTERTFLLNSQDEYSMTFGLLLGQILHYYFYYKKPINQGVTTLLKYKEKDDEIMFFEGI